jgi:cytochrome c oxidase subunit 3
MTHADSHGDHPPHLQHHFDTPEQQLESGKLGMWVFLATEVLFFGGLFCAYAIYRANHPEIFIYGHQYLNKYLGGLNTVVLLCSSFTMAWAVRASQLGRKKALIWLLSLTVAGGFVFMGVKYVEYKEKWEHGLLWGTSYVAQDHHEGEADAEHVPAAVETAAPVEATEPVAEAAATETGAASTEPVAEGLKIERSLIQPSPEGPSGTVASEAPAEEGHSDAAPKNVHIFFGIYFVMTGLHGIHVILGIVVISWLIFRSARGDFSAAYYTPVDLVGLYWHLVDLIWIFLFPLLYLIH